MLLRPIWHLSLLLDAHPSNKPWKLTALVLLPAPPMDVMYAKPSILYFKMFASGVILCSRYSQIVLLSILVQLDFTSLMGFATHVPLDVLLAPIPTPVLLAKHHCSSKLQAMSIKKQ